MFAASTLNTALPAGSIVPGLHKPITDPKERFALYDAPTPLVVEESAITHACTRGFFDAYDGRALLTDTVCTSIYGLPHPFGGHPDGESGTALSPALLRIARPGAAPAPTKTPACRSPR